MRTHSIILFITLLLLSLTSCQKLIDTRIDRTFSTDRLLQEINEFNPSNDKARILFYGFENEIRSSDNLMKSLVNAEDRVLGEAIWVIGATINKNYGFKKDSIEYLVIDTLFNSIPIKSFNSDGLPIIDGQIILQFYSDIECAIVSNEQDGFSFWSLALIVDAIDENEAEVMSIRSGGPKSNTRRYLITPLPPGTELPLFEDDDWLWAGNATMHAPEMRASYVFWDRINGLGPFVPLDPEYVYTYFYSHSIDAYIAPGVAESRILWDYGRCGYRKIYGPELNQYLLSTKNLIDENNPRYNGNQTEDLLIGWFYIYCQDFICYSPPCPSPGTSYFMDWFSHDYFYQVFRRTYIGPPID